VIDLNEVQSVLDLGCGDGFVASMIEVEQYVGFDLSESALKIARERMPNHRFLSVTPRLMKFDLMVSMDVMHHLVTEEVYRSYLKVLFSDLSDLVLVYGTNHRLSGRPHVLHREWMNDVPKGWQSHELPSRFKKAWLIQRS
jgi:SAM-dependent methyltransferase